MLVIADHDGMVIDIEDNKHGSFVGLTLGGVNIELDIGLSGLWYGLIPSKMQHHRWLLQLASAVPEIQLTFYDN